jgi:hypothetical protein
MKRALNTIPLSKRKHYMSNFFVPRTNNRKPIVSKTPFVGYERAYRSDAVETGEAAGGRQAPTTQCLNPLIVKEGYGEPLVPWTSSSPIAEVVMNDQDPSQNDTINNIMSGPVPVLGPVPVETQSHESASFDSFQVT